MNYYPFHIGDYATHTAHLEPMEDLAYRRMLDLYYLREGRLPAEPNEVARLVRLRDHAQAVQAVLHEFFLPTAEGWLHARCDEEIKRFNARQEAAVKAGRASAERRLNERSTPPADDAEGPSTNHNQNHNQNHTSSSTKKSKATITRPTDVSMEVWHSFLQVRRTKKAAVTELAILGIRREAVAAGLSLEQALVICCERGWAGFKADWMRESANPTESFYEREQRAKRQRWEEMTGQKWPTESSTFSENVIDAELPTMLGGPQ